MKRVMISLLGLLVLACAPRFAPAQETQQRAATAVQATQSASATASQSGQMVQVREGTKISAVLVSRIDARTAKTGDKVVAGVTKNVKQNGRTVIHKGDEIVGHVTKVEAGTYKTGSTVTVAFDQLASGKTTMQLNTVLAQVVALPGTRLRPDDQNIGGPMDPTSMRVRRNSPGVLQDPGLADGTLGGSTTGSVGGAVGTLDQTVDASVGGPVERVDGQANTIGGVTADRNTQVSLSTPLQELRVKPGLQDKNQTGASSVLSSHHGNLRLDAGTRVQFRVAAEARAQSASK